MILIMIKNLIGDLPYLKPHLKRIQVIFLIYSDLVRLGTMIHFEGLYCLVIMNK